MVVAVGGSGSAASCFVSTDGTTWTAAPEQEALLGAEMTSIAFRNGAFVATGLLTGPSDTFPSTPAISLSRDGLHWSLVLQGGSLLRISQAVSADAGFVAIGGYFPSAGWSYDAADPIPPATHSNSGSRPTARHGAVSQQDSSPMAGSAHLDKRRSGEGTCSSRSPSSTPGRTALSTSR